MGRYDMFKLATLFLLFVAATCPAAQAWEGDRERRPDFEYVRGSDPWFTAHNAAGLYRFYLEDISFGEAFFSKDDGKFVNYYQSDNSYRYGAQAESFHRLNRRTVLYGKVSYTNFEGKHMGGSYFIDPRRNPFDLVEQADSTAGDKQLERYHLAGAFSIEPCARLRVGAKIDYQTANYAKFKDLRHKNKLMDMVLTVGASYAPARNIEVGANYFYRRGTESVVLKSYGNTDQQFYSLINFGSFYGRREIHGDAGYTESGDDKPLFNEYHGASLQLYLRLSPRVSFFNEATYKRRDGYFGTRSPSTVVFTEHNSHIIEYDATLSLASANASHALRFTACNEDLENYENVYKTENTTGGNRDVVYYGSNKVLAAKQLDLRLSYTGNLNVIDHHPAWVLKADAAYSERKRTTSLYPCYRRQTVRATQFGLSGQRNLFRRSAVYSISLHAGFGTGSGTKQDDGLYTDNAGGAAPESHDTLLNREYEYLTASRMNAGAGFACTKPVSRELALYAGVSYQFVKAFDVEYLKGSSAGSVMVRVGCNF